MGAVPHQHGEIDNRIFDIGGINLISRQAGSYVVRRENGGSDTSLAFPKVAVDCAGEAKLKSEELRNALRGYGVHLHADTTRLALKAGVIVHSY